MKQARSWISAFILLGVAEAWKLRQPDNTVSAIELSDMHANDECILPAGKEYSPLDMAGQGRTVTESAELCQERCANVAGCAYFSWWANGGCHLQDASAKLKSGSAAAAGPATCGAEIKYCSTFVCLESHGYQANIKYKGNPGASPEECCDALCLRFECNNTHGVPKDREKLAGATHAACCALKCSWHNCIGPWTEDKTKNDVVPQEGDDLNKVCCQPSCASVTCDRAKGMLVDPKKATKPAGDESYCCLTTCKAFQGSCTTNRAVPTSRLNWILGGKDNKGGEVGAADCCDDTCQKIKDEACDEGWAYIPALHSLVIADLPAGKTGCCQRTCAAYTCSEGWTANPAHATYHWRNGSESEIAEPDDEMCCTRTCKLHNCNRSAGFFTSIDPQKLAKKAATDQECCDQSCSLQPEDQCSSIGLSDIEPRNATPYRNDPGHKSCCEPQLCKTLRASKQKLDPLDGSACNGKDTIASCHQYMAAFPDADKDILVPCVWNATLSFCIVSKNKTSGCERESQEQNKTS